MQETTENLFSIYNSTDGSYNNKFKMLNDKDLIDACILFKLLFYYYLNVFDKDSILTFVSPVMLYLNNIFISNFGTFTNQQNEIEKIKFIIFIMMVCVCFFVIWIPYLSKVKKKIWRVKGMLNMIPMDIIANNENLKVALISDDITQAVK